MANHMNSSNANTMTSAMTSGIATRSADGNRVDLGREVEVELREPAGVVRRQRDVDLPPANVEIGVVIGPLGEEADADDERDGVGERSGVRKLLPISSPARAQPGSAARAAVISGPGASRPGHRPHSTATRSRRATLVVCRSTSPKPNPPIEVELDRARGLALRWADGTTAHFDFEELRRNCPCAECRGVREQGRRGRRGPDRATAIDAKLIGAWGVSIRWSDGHDTGIYAWSILRAWAGLDRIVLSSRVTTNPTSGSRANENAARAHAEQPDQQRGGRERDHVRPRPQRGIDREHASVRLDRSRPLQHRVARRDEPSRSHCPTSAIPMNAATTRLVPT